MQCIAPFAHLMQLSRVLGPVCITVLCVTPGAYLARGPLWIRTMALCMGNTDYCETSSSHVQGSMYVWIVICYRNNLFSRKAHCMRQCWSFSGIFIIL